MAAPEITHNTARHRFEISLDGTHVGSSYYRESAGQRAFTHTEVDPDYQGHGLATQLIEYSLTATKDSGLRIVALCPMVAAYVEKHHEFDEDLDENEAEAS